MRPRARSTHRSDSRGVRCGVGLLAATVTGALAYSTFLMSPAGAAVHNFPAIGTFNGVACPSTQQCLAVGIILSMASSGALGVAALLDPSTGTLSSGQSTQTIAATESLDGVSCPSVTRCLAVGESSDESNGVAVSLNPTTGAVRSGRSVQTIPGIVMAAVSCPSATKCLAVGRSSAGAGVAVALNPSTGAIVRGQSVQTISGIGGVGLEGVACPSASECVAVGEDAGESAGAAVLLDPATGTVVTGAIVQNVTTKGILSGVSCPSATQCLAVGWGADEPSLAVPLDAATGGVPSGQADHTISSRAAILSAVTCPSTTQCLAVGNDDGDPSAGQAVPLNPVTGAISGAQSIRGVAGTGALDTVTCPSTAQCLAAGMSFESTGAASVSLSPVTAVLSAPASAPSSATLASTGANLVPLIVVGGGLLVVGLVTLCVASRRRRRTSNARTGPAE